MPSTTFSIRLSPETRDQITDLAKATGHSANFILNEAVREYLERERWQIADIEQGLRELEAGDIATEEELDATFSRITTPEAMERARLAVAAERW